MTERTPELIDPANFDPMEEAFNFEAIRTELGITSVPYELLSINVKWRTTREKT